MTAGGVREVYRGLLRRAGSLDGATLMRAADRFDAAVQAMPQGLETELLRARGAALLANVLPLHGAAGRPWSDRALELATPLRGASALPSGGADGVIAEAYLARCAAASTTAMRALYAHQGCSALRRALAADRRELSANFAAGSFALHTPVVFGGDAARAARHFECVLDVEPCHGGAQLLLARAYERQGRRAASDAAFARLLATAPRLAELADRSSRDPGAVARERRDG